MTSLAAEMIERAWSIRRSALALDSVHERQLILSKDVRPVLVDALGLSREAGESSLVLVALGKLSHVERDLGNHEEAEDLLVEAVQLARLQQNPARLAHSIRHMADLYTEAGQALEARTLLEESVELYRTMAPPPPLDYANALYRLAHSSETIDARAALAMWIEARDLFKHLNIREGVEMCEAHIAKLEST